MDLLKYEIFVEQEFLNTATLRTRIHEQKPRAFWLGDCFPVSNISNDDRTYLAHLVAARTGLSQDESQRRVDDAITKAQQAADAARKATRDLALCIGFSMLIGAFIAGVAAKIGGHHRGQLVVT